MTHTTDARSFWKGLVKSVLVITTVSSGASVAAPDVSTDEPAQLSNDSIAVEVRAVSRRPITTSPLSTRGTDEQGSPGAQSREAATTLHADESTPHGEPEFKIPRNSFGAGSFAISALGFTASK
jgi:hypothetical protein